MVPCLAPYWWLQLGAMLAQSPPIATLSTSLCALPLAMLNITEMKVAGTEAQSHLQPRRCCPILDCAVLSMLRIIRVMMNMLRCWE